jgi:hypothetical protein
MTHSQSPSLSPKAAQLNTSSVSEPEINSLAHISFSMPIPMVMVYTFFGMGYIVSLFLYSLYSKLIHTSFIKFGLDTVSRRISMRRFAHFAYKATTINLE